MPARFQPVHWITLLTWLLGVAGAARVVPPAARRLRESTELPAQQLAEPGFWDYMPDCNATLLPLLPKNDRPTKLPAHGTAVVTVTHRLNSQQQHTWHRFYSRAFGPENLYIGIHMHGDCSWNSNCDTAATEKAFRFSPMMAKMFARGSKLVAAECGHGHIVGQTTIHVANTLAQKLFHMGYSKVIFAEDDEFLVPDPDKYPGGILEYVEKIPLNGTKPWRRAHSYTVREGDSEGKLDRSKAILHQRHEWKIGDPYYCKAFITLTRGEYGGGGHSWHPYDTELLAKYGGEVKENCTQNADPDLVMIHLKCVDKDQFREQTFREYTVEQRWARDKVAFESQDSQEFKDFFNKVWVKGKSECGYKNIINQDGYNNSIDYIPQKWIEHAGI